LRAAISGEGEDAKINADSFLEMKADTALIHQPMEADKLAHLRYRSAFTHACIAGDLAKAQALWTEGLTLADVRHCQVFRVACTAGFLGLAQWLYSLGLTHADLSESIAPLIPACTSGSLEMVKWVCSLGLTREMVLAGNNGAFRVTCRHGYLNIAQWLVKEYTMTLKEINSGWDDAFHSACDSGNLALAQWLHELGLGPQKERPDDMWRYDRSFRLACFGGYLSIAQWLWELGLPSGQSVFLNIRSFIGQLPHQRAVAEWFRTLKYPQQNEAWQWS